MYLIKPNIERIFDDVLKKTIPYLIIAPPEFRNKLADQMESLFHFYNGGDSSVDLFISRSKQIIEMIAEAEDSFDTDTNIKINRFNELQNSFGELIRKLDERLTKLENARKEKKKAPIERRKKKYTTAEIDQKLELLRNYLKENKEIANKQCRDICSVGIKQAGNLLKKLIKENFVERKGKGRKTKYIIR